MVAFPQPQTDGVQDAYAPTPRTTPSRYRDRARYDRATVHAILDEALICHVGFVVDGYPVVLPTTFARVEDRLYIHGSTGSRPMLRAVRASGVAVCVSVAHLDGLVLARSAAHHSLAYRSVIAHGIAKPVTDPDEKEAALAALVNRAAAGRYADCRPPSPRELASVAVLRLDLDEVSAKVRGPLINDEPEDLGLDYWAGFIPVRTGRGPARPAPDLRPGVTPPPYVVALASRGATSRAAECREDQVRQAC